MRHDVNAPPRVAGKQLLNVIKQYGTVNEACLWLSSATGVAVTPARLYHWARRGVPAKFALPIEHWTHGAVKRNELRPDVFGHDHA